MDALTRFVSDQNVARFVAALRAEGDPNRRKSLEQLLREEVFRLGAHYDRLEVIDRNLTDGAIRIESQKLVIENAQKNEADSSQMEKELSNLVAMQEMFFSSGRGWPEILRRSRRLIASNS